MGRITNRFAKDLDQIDYLMPMTLRHLLGNLAQLLAVFIVVCVSMPTTLIVALPALVLFALLLFVCVPASRQLRRLEAVTRSPLFSHFAASLSGTVYFRSFVYDWSKAFRVSCLTHATTTI